MWSPDPDEVLSQTQLRELAHSLALLPSSRVEEIYREAHQKCAPVAGRVPKASAVQELVTA